MTPPPRVLYVDDEPNLLAAFVRLFRKSNLEIHTTQNPLEALALLEQTSFDVVASDYNMPHLNGAQFFAKVQEISPRSVRVLITGMADFQAAAQAINTGRVYALITKPWDASDLRDVVHRGIEFAQLERENREMHELLTRKNHELEELNVHLDRLVQERTTNLLDMLVCALDLRDTETQWHSRRVALFSRRIAQALNIAESQELLDIERGALLHDIGKIGISDTILLKPSKLTPEEWQEMYKHPELGFNMLQDIKFLTDARKIVLHHQERFDGKGYPFGLKSKEIVIGARIFCVADTLDAITSDRPYRRAQSFEKAVEEISKHRETQFDPDVVDAFLSLNEDEFNSLRNVAARSRELSLLEGKVLAPEEIRQQLAAPYPSINISGR
jgi:putative nucleotidyltransferase with HDIG domain